MNHVVSQKPFFKNGVCQMNLLIDYFVYTWTFLT
jgi:hypothetical protein